MALWALREAAECARHCGGGGGQHRGRERGKWIRRLRIESGVTLPTKDEFLRV
jgi:hypothetical protein